MLFVFVLVCAEWFFEETIPAVSFVSSALLSGCELLLFIPLCTEDLASGRRGFAIAALSLSVCYLSARELCLSCSYAILAVNPFLLTGFFVIKSVRRFASIRPLFKADAVWTSIEEHFRFLYGLFLELLVTSALIAASVGRCIAFDLALLSLSAGLFVVLWLRVYYGRTYFLSRRKEQTIRESISNFTRMTPPDRPEDEERMNATYRRILTIMDERKPFLKDTYYITDLCSDVGANKSFVSNVINVYSGRNFRQFVNYYRIKYALKLMKENPSGLIMDTALKCGFHSVVSFNMAFRLNMHMTPSDYMSRIRGPEGLSKIREQDR